MPLAVGGVLDAWRHRQTRQTQAARMRSFRFRIFNSRGTWERVSGHMGA